MVFKFFKIGGYISGSGDAAANGEILISNTTLGNLYLIKITAFDNRIYSLIVGTNQGFDTNSSSRNIQFYSFGGGANQ
jgi:hypothetical protein